MTRGRRDRRHPVAPVRQGATRPVTGPIPPPLIQLLFLSE
jgi:hypothetical protein